MKHIRSINEFQDLSRENNYIIEDRDGSLSLDTEQIVKDLMKALPYYQKRLPYYDGADRTLTLQEIEELAWSFAEIDSDKLQELTLGGSEGEIGIEGSDDDDDLSFTEMRDSMIHAWSNCNIDDLSDMFVDFVEDEVIGTERHFG